MPAPTGQRLGASVRARVAYVRACVDRVLFTRAVHCCRVCCRLALARVRAFVMVMEWRVEQSPRVRFMCFVCVCGLRDDLCAMCEADDLVWRGLSCRREMERGRGAEGMHRAWHKGVPHSIWCCSVGCSCKYNTYIVRVVLASAQRAETVEHALNLI